MVSKAMVAPPLRPATGPGDAVTQPPNAAAHSAAASRRRSGKTM
jgi:hypothetical protein